MSDTLLSIIIPVKNEAESLPLTLASIDKQLDGLDFPAEVVVVSCGSTDNTPEIVKKMSVAIRNLKLVVNEENNKTGLGLRQGMLLSKGKFKLAVSSGNLIPIGQFNKLKPLLESGADVVVGRRTNPNLESKTYFSKISSMYQKIPARLANFFLRSLIFKEIKDPTSNFVAFSSEAAEKIFNLTRYHRLENLLEPIFIAKKSGFRVREADVFVV